jgi:gluconolactonase
VQGVPPAGFGNGSTSNVEGPVWIGDSLYVSHLQEGVANPPPSRILKITGTTVTELVNPSGSNGLAVMPDGRLVAARHSDGSFVVFDFASNSFVSPPLAGSYMGARFDSPNDLAVRSDGNVYFSDPDYQAPTPHPQPKTGVYRVSPNGVVSLVDDSLDEPNGVTLSPDETILYVSSTTTGVTSYPVAADGSVGAGTPFFGTGSDGMGIDCAGNLYLSNGDDVILVAPDGTSLGEIAQAVAPDSTTNLAFGGANHQRLFITARGSSAGLWYVDLLVPGKPY